MVSSFAKTFNDKLAQVWYFQIVLGTFVGISLVCGTGPIILWTSLGKTFLAWRFILKENIVFLVTISYQKPFVIFVSAFFS